MQRGEGRLTGSALAMVLLTLLQRAVGFLTVWILSRIVGPRDLGLIASVQSSGQVIYVLSKFGIDNGLLVGASDPDLINDKTYAKCLLSEMVTIFAIFSLGSFLVFFVFSEKLNMLLFDGALPPAYMYAASAISSATVFSQFAFCVFTGLKQSKIYARAVGVSAVVGFFFIVAAALILDAYLVVWAIVLASFITCSATFILLCLQLRKIDISLRLKWPTRVSMKFIWIGVPHYLNSMLLAPAELFCISLLLRSVGADAMGNLRVTQALASIFLLVPGAISAPLLADLSARMSDKSDVSPVFSQIKWMWLATSLLVIPSAIIWPVGVKLIFGPNFAQAASYGPLILSTLVPMTLIGLLINGFMASERPVFVSAIGFIQLIMMYFFSSLILNYGLSGYILNQTIYISSGVFLGFVLFKIVFRANFLKEWFLFLLVSNLISLAFVLFFVFSDVQEWKKVVGGVFLFIIFMVGAKIWVVSAAELEFLKAKIMAYVIKLKRETPA